MRSLLSVKCMPGPSTRRGPASVRVTDRAGRVDPDQSGPGLAGLTTALNLATVLHEYAAPCAPQACSQRRPAMRSLFGSVLTGRMNWAKTNKQDQAEKHQQYQVKPQAERPPRALPLRT